MFAALIGLLANVASLNLFIVGNSDGTITVTVMPERKDGGDGALSTPLSLTGTPEELDTQFAELVAGYTASRLSLAEQLEATQAVLAAAKQDAAAKATKAVSKPAQIASPASGGDHDLDDDDNCGSDVGGAAVAPTSSQQPEVNLFG